MTPAQSCLAGLPFLLAGAPAACPRNYSIDCKGLGSSKGPSEQPQAKRNLNSGADDAKKLCTEARWSGREFHGSAGQSQQQKGDRSSERAHGKQIARREEGIVSPEIADRFFFTAIHSRILSCLFPLASLLLFCNPSLFILLLEI